MNAVAPLLAGARRISSSLHHLVLFLCFAYGAHWNDGGCARIAGPWRAQRPEDSRSRVDRTIFAFVRTWRAGREYVRFAGPVEFRYVDDDGINPRSTHSRSSGASSQAVRWRADSQFLRTALAVSQPNCSARTPRPDSTRGGYPARAEASHEAEQGITSSSSRK